MPSDLSIPIETTRLLIRPYRTDDAIWYYKMSLKNKEHLARYESENPIMSIMSETDAEKTIKDFISLWDGQKYRFFGVFLKDTNDFVGQIYLGKLNDQLPEFGIGYIAEIEHVGNGYVTEAVHAVVKEIFENIERINQEMQTTLLIVEQNAKIALDISTYAYIMESGKIVLEGPSDELKNNPDVKEFYMGVTKGGRRKSFKDVKSYKRRKRWM